MTPSRAVNEPLMSSKIVALESELTERITFTFVSKVRFSRTAFRITVPSAAVAVLGLQSSTTSASFG